MSAPDTAYAILDASAAERLAAASAPDRRAVHDALTDVYGIISAATALAQRLHTQLRDRDTPDADQRLSVDQVATALGICARTVRNRIRSGELRHVRDGRRLLVPEGCGSSSLTRNSFIVSTYSVY